MHLNSTANKICCYQFAGKSCNNCGQKASIGTMNFQDIFHEAWHNLTHTDTGYLQLSYENLLLQFGVPIDNLKLF